MSSQREISPPSLNPDVEASGDDITAPHFLLEESLGGIRLPLTDSFLPGVGSGTRRLQ